MLKLLSIFLLLDLDNILNKTRIHIMLSRIYKQRIGSLISRTHASRTVQRLIDFVRDRPSFYLVHPFIILNFIVQVSLSLNSLPYRVSFRGLKISLNLTDSKLIWVCRSLDRFPRPALVPIFRAPICDRCVIAKLMLHLLTFIGELRL